MTTVADILIRDAEGMPVPQYFNNDTGLFETINGSEGAAQMTSLARKFRSNFGGSLNTEKWELVQTGGGAAVAHTATTMTITSGTTINAETIIRSVAMFQPSLRLFAAIQASQRIANAEFFVEMVSVDPVTGIPDGIDRVAWVVTGATATSMQTQAQANGASGLIATARTVTTITNSIQGFEIEMCPDETWFHQRAVDSTAARVQSYVHNRTSPDPNRWYKIQLRVKNGAVAPASSTTYTIDFVSLIDYSELTAEVTGGRGGGVPGTALPVNVAGGTVTTVSTVTAVTGITNTVTMNTNQLMAAQTVTNLGVSAIFTGTAIDTTATFGYNRARALVAHTAGSTPGHLVLEQSSDNTTWRETNRVPVPSDGLHRTFEFVVVQRYVRYKFENGATAQSAFYLHSDVVRFDGLSPDAHTPLNFIDSIAVLAGAATFNGVTLNLGPQPIHTLFRAWAYSDQAGTLNIQVSRDGTNWRTAMSMSVTASSYKELELKVQTRFVRVSYTNGATLQGTFELGSALVA